jgi:type VI protein secretion system component VasF
MGLQHSRTEHRSRRPAAEPAPEGLNTLVALAYELLDAHADTARLTEEDASAAEWQDHLAYLRDLQRVGREALARAAYSGNRAPAGGPSGSAVCVRARRG